MRNATMFSSLWGEIRDLVANDPDAAAEAERAREEQAAEGLEASRPRARRGYGLLKGRRTRFQAKRRTGKLTAGTAVHRGEREIIARD